MHPTTLMFGAIGTMMETSDIQRRAYNQALREAGLNWVWTRDVYAELLSQSGGQERLAMLAAATGANLSPQQIESIHTRKTELACHELLSQRQALRPGVSELIGWALARQFKLAFVTTTYQQNIDAVFASAGTALSKADFHYIGSRGDVERGKPAPDAYIKALASLKIRPEQAVAIEDTAASVMSAKRAGLQVIATPGEISDGQDLWQADLVCGSLLGPDGKLNARVLSLLGQ